MTKQNFVYHKRHDAKNTNRDTLKYDYKRKHTHTISRKNLLLNIFMFQSEDAKLELPFFQLPHLP